MILPEQRIEDNAAYQCTAMLFYIWQLQDKLPYLLLSYQRIQHRFKKHFASYYSQISEILCQAIFFQDGNLIKT